jgi:hypothetical protein
MRSQDAFVMAVGVGGWFHGQGAGDVSGVARRMRIILLPPR